MGEFRICPIETGLGQAILQHYGLDAKDPDSWLNLAEGKAYASMDAIVRAGARLGCLGRLLRALIILPRSIQDWLPQSLSASRSHQNVRHSRPSAQATPAVASRLVNAAGAGVTPHHI
jgi:predicted DCC family thiol-disulfide oxidoreductase YuxK